MIYTKAVRLPAAFRFDTDEVFVRKDDETGDIILSRKPADWSGFFQLVDGDPAPAGFLDRDERNQAAQDRDPFEGMEKSGPLSRARGLRWRRST